MARNPVSTMVDVALAPAKIGTRLAGRVLGRVGGRTPPPAERRDRPRDPDPQLDPRPKPLDDATLARKVETVIFRDRSIAKGKVDVNVADGVVWLRGEVKRPDLVQKVERKVRQVPEVHGVENLLHLPKTPAPSRTDTPAPQRKARRKSRPARNRKVTLGKVTEEAPKPEGAEPTPKEVARRGGGRKAARLGAEDKPSGEGRRQRS